MLDVKLLEFVKNDQVIAHESFKWCQAFCDNKLQKAWKFGAEWG